MSKIFLRHTLTKKKLKLEEGRVVIKGFENKINNKLCVVPKARTLRIKK